MHNKWYIVPSSDPKLVEFLKKRKREAQEKKEAEKREKASKISGQIDQAAAMDATDTGFNSQCSSDNVSIFLIFFDGSWLHLAV